MVRSGYSSNKVSCSVRWVGRSVVLTGLLSVGGCMTLKPKPDFDSALPQDRFLAARQAKASSDETAVVDLIRQLSSDDVLVRLVANDALESITGQRYGFDADASADARRDAIGRWAAWNDARTAEVGVEGAGDE